MNRVVVWIATAVLLVAAGLISHFAPPEDAEVAPFVATGSLGDQVSGRDIAATVTSVTRTSLLRDSTGWSAEGIWFVVELEAMNVVGPPASGLDGAGAVRGAHLIVDGRTYRATERTDSMHQSRLFPGVVRAGALAFELSEAPDADATIVLRLSADEDSRADSVLEIAFPAASVPQVAEITMPAVGWAR